MNVQNNDWLDEKLTRMDYLPDDGFTAQVMQQLPKKRPARSGLCRRSILALSSVVAASLLVLHLVQLVRSLQSVNPSPLVSRYLSPEGLVHLVALVQQPIVLYSIAASFILLCIAALPFLNRWV